MSDVSILRQTQWDLFVKPYESLLTKINHLANENNENKLEIISLESLAKEYGVQQIYEKISVDEKTFVAEMCCVDEGIQEGVYSQEEDLFGHRLGTLADPQSSKYMIDLPGSGALKINCPELKNCKNCAEDILALEDSRLDDLAKKTVVWCQKKEIVKFTVTYHCGCGAISIRMKNFPEICCEDELTEAKNCALKLAKKIDLQAKTVGYDLNVTTALIGDDQMTKIRPMSMHNAIGTIVNLDDSILPNKVDDFLGLNFFDVYVNADFESKNDEYKESVSEAADDIVLTYKIATGSHGWGESQFDSDNPYLVLFFAKSKDQIEQAKAVASAIDNRIEGSQSLKMLAVQC